MIIYKDGKKVCSKCKEARGVNKFDRWNNYADGYYPSCKICKSAIKSAWDKNNPEKKLASARRHYQKNKINIIKRTSAYIKKNPHIRKKSLLNFVYGITPEQHQKLLNMNDGKCCICNLPPQTRSLFIDHCHKTNVIRGVLCQKCNSAIGFFNDDINLLQSAIKYLTKER